MKIKTIAKALACATALSVAVSSSAFAAAPTMEASRAGSNVTVNYSGITGQMTLLAFDITEAYATLTGDAKDTPYEKQEIVYVTQEDAGSSKTFTVKDGWAPAEGSEAKYLLVKVGGTDIDTPAAQVVTFDYQAGEQFKYGDVTGEGNINISDALEIVKYNQGVADWDENSVKYAAANVNGDDKVNISDALEIVKYNQNVITSFKADEDGDGFGTFTGTAAASIEEPEEVVETEDNAEVVEPEEATEPEAEAPAEDSEEVKSEEVTEEVEESEEAAEETSEEEPEAETEAEAEAE